MKGSGCFTSAFAAEFCSSDDRCNGGRTAAGGGGVGRIGLYHARHVQELGRERGLCELVGVVDGYGDIAQRVAK